MLSAYYIWNRLRKWHSSNYRNYPWRAKGISTWGILLAEMLLKKTDSPTVAKVFPLLYSAYPTPNTLAEASLQEIISYIKPLGLWNQRSNSLLQLAKALVYRHQGKIPKDLESLQALPNVGPYIAGAVLVFAFGKPSPMPDVNIIRIMSRFYCLPSKTQSDYLRLADQALMLCPKTKPREFYYALLDLGAAHCRLRPNCPGCPLGLKCQSRNGVKLQADLII